MAPEPPWLPVSAIDALGLAPTAEQVDEWLTSSLRYTRYRAGTSLQGRDLLYYSSEPLEHPQGTQPIVLFLSLVHGNEPAGLLSLLAAVEQLAATRERRHLRSTDTPVTPILIVFPIVNIDSYVANLEYGNGCRRTNMRHTCQTEGQPIHACPQDSRGGVDLNRNHPMDWDGPYADEDDMGGPCGITYQGRAPWSEPEARAIRDIVLQHRPRAAMSFHTRGLIQSKALLIHPYTSARPLKMLEHRDLYREWSRKLNDRRLYVTGTAQEAIHYTASGSTIDWMESQGVVSFVMESRTPCQEGRWCPLEFFDAVKAIAEQDGRTGTILVDLVAAAATSPSSSAATIHWDGRSFVRPVILVILAVLIVVSNRRRLSIRIRRERHRSSLHRASKLV